MTARFRGSVKTVKIRRPLILERRKLGPRGATHIGQSHLLSRWQQSLEQRNFTLNQMRGRAGLLSAMKM